MTREEKILIIIAEREDDKKAEVAMRELREKYDPSYHWCLDCDYAVVKDSECCMNRNEDEETKD